MYYDDDDLTEEGTAAPLSVAALQRLLALARPHWRALLGAGGLMLVSTGLALALPVLVHAVLDQVVTHHDVHALDRLAAGLLGLLVLMAGCTWAEMTWLAAIGNRIVTALRGRVFAHIQRLPVAFFDRTRTGELASRLATDITLLQQTLTEDCVQVAGQVVTLLGGLGLALVLNWRLTGVVVALLTGLAGGVLLSGRRVRGRTREALAVLAEAMGTMTETLANIRLVKAFAREDYEVARVRRQLHAVQRANMRVSRAEAALGALAGTAYLAVLLGVVWYGSRSVLAGHLTLGSIVGFVMMMTLISGPLHALTDLYAQLQRAMGAADRLFAVLDEAPEPAEDTAAGPFPPGPGAIRCAGVTFAYAPGQPVLRDLSLEVPAGRVTALVGASGAGKSTLAALLHRFYEPQAGGIWIDGVPLAQIPRAAVREHLGLVPQEPLLFEGTIRENIRYGRLEATDAEIEAAAGAAHVTEFVAAWPEGYDTLIGERGVTLSGGQRQRIAIARALVKNPPILILDEATSALDTQTERLVQDALTRLMAGRTTLVIAHRLSTIEHADQVVVLQAGRVVERGTHDTLVRAAGYYAALHHAARPSLQSAGVPASPRLMDLEGGAGSGAEPRPHKME